MPSQPWEGPSGGAYFVPESMPAEEKSQLVAEQRERFGRYLTHADEAWGGFLTEIGMPDGTPEHTGGGTITVMFHRPNSGYSILVGPFGADPDPSGDVSMGVVTPCFTDAVESVEEWTDSRPGFLDFDPNRSLEEFSEWLKLGVEMIDSDPFAERPSES